MAVDQLGFDVVELLADFLIERSPRAAYAGYVSKPGWGFSVAAFVAGVFALAIVVLLVLGVRGLF